MHESPSLFSIAFVLMYNNRREIQMSEQPIRVLVAKPGLDGHDRGAKVVARALRDAGMEVIYTGIRQTPEMIVQAALQEDVNVIGLSILSGAHMDLFPRIVALAKEKKLDDVVFVCGGIVPEEDIAPLKAMGFTGVFGPGAFTQDIIKFIRDEVARKRTVAHA